METTNSHIRNSTFPNDANDLLLEHMRKVYDQFEEKVAQLSIIRELGTALLHISDFERICRTILDVIIKNTAARNCSIMLMDEEKNRLFLIAAANPEGESYIIDARQIFSKKDVKYTLGPDDGAAREAVARKEPVLIKDMNSSDTSAYQSDTEINTGTLFSIPLIIEDTVLGVLTLSHPVKGMFEANDINLLNIVANFVALAITSSLNYVRLQYSEEKYRALAEHSNDGVAIIQDGMHQYANPSYELLTGYGFNELREIPFEDLIAPQSNAADINNDSFRNSYIPGTYETVMTGKSGQKRAAEISHGVFVFKGRPAEVISVRDLTERKELEKQLWQAQKMQAIGTLAGGIAHDFNNLLMGIQGNTSLMLIDLDHVHPYHRRLKSIETQVQSGARLTSHLLGYARKGRYDVKPLDLNQLLERTSDTFGRTAKKITIHRELAGDLFPTEADRGQIEQVLFNLYANAADAMPGGGALTLKTMNATHEEIKGKLPDPNVRNYVLLSVTDTGIGMDKSTMERIFDPFFTTKNMDRTGTGLGLAAAYGIMRSHGGYIDVESEKEQGTTFKLYLPASAEARAVVRLYDKIIGAAGTVFLVDDEHEVLQVCRELLETMGSRVLTARDGNEAVEVYEKNWREIDIVVLDMVMPNMGGGEAYDRMKRINPEIRVLLSSGFSIDGEATEILERGCDGFIKKPFTVKELRLNIKAIMDKR